MRGAAGCAGWIGLLVRATQWLAVALAVASGPASAGAGQAGPDWLIVPGVRVGAITRAAGELDLVRAYGLGNVRNQSVHVGEGIAERGTVVFPDDPTRAAAVLWKDLQNNWLPERVQITGSRSLWRTAQGIALGTSLKDIERMNGRPFALTGFGWDYGGTIIAWMQGRLEREFTKGGRIIFRLRPAGRSPASGAARRLIVSVSGDRVFRSSHSAMRQINPRVYQMIIEFR